MTQHAQDPEGQFKVKKPPQLKKSWKQKPCMVATTFLAFFTWYRGLCLALLAIYCVCYDSDRVAAENLDDVTTFDKRLLWIHYRPGAWMAFCYGIFLATIGLFVCTQLVKASRDSCSASRLRRCDSVGLLLALHLFDFTLYFLLCTGSVNFFPDLFWYRTAPDWIDNYILSKRFVGEYEHIFALGQTILLFGNFVYLFFGYAVTITWLYPQPATESEQTKVITAMPRNILNNADDQFEIRLEKNSRCGKIIHI